MIERGMEADEGGRVWGDEGETGVQEGLPFELLACGFFFSRPIMESLPLLRD